MAYIDTAAALERCVAWLARAPVIGIDTESDSFHRYREKVCLIQVTALGEDIIIDPLALADLRPLAPILADPARLKIFHDAGYDLLCLRRDFGFRVAGLFDTMWASRLAGVRQFGLAAILRARFGVEADKAYQRSDWAQRPLDQAQLAYARQDTHYLPQLQAALTDELRAQGRLGWACEDFARIAALADAPVVRRVDSDGDQFWRIRGARELSPAARGRLRALYLAREHLAARLDRPPFKIAADGLLVTWAQRTPEALTATGEGRSQARTPAAVLGPQVLTAVADAAPITADPPHGVGRRRRSGRMLDPEVRQRYEALRRCRQKLADGLDIEPDVALGNALLEDLARDPPGDLADMAQRRHMHGWRHGAFAQSIWQCLRLLLQSQAV